MVPFVVELKNVTNRTTDHILINDAKGSPSPLHTGIGIIRILHIVRSRRDKRVPSCTVVL